MSERHSRQSFLGHCSEEILQGRRVAIVGYGGGGSHIGQQLAHIGFGEVTVIDGDAIEESNLNRLVGGTSEDVMVGARKVDIAYRVIKAVRPATVVERVASDWAEASALMREAHIVMGAVDSFAGRVQLEAFCRRHLMPYIDIGMDVAGEPPDFRIFGQVVLSSPGRPCLRCMGVVTERMLEQEERARQYGEAGSKPQVIWPNGVLASTAVGLLMQLVTPWHARPVESAHLEYDGNSHTLRHAPRLKVILERAIPCTHYLAHEVGDPFFGTALDRSRRQSSAPANE